MNQGATHARCGCQVPNNWEATLLHSQKGLLMGDCFVSLKLPLAFVSLRLGLRRLHGLTRWPPAVAFLGWQKCQHLCQHSDALESSQNQIGRVALCQWLSRIPRRLVLTDHGTRADWGTRALTGVQEDKRQAIKRFLAFPCAQATHH